MKKPKKTHQQLLAEVVLRKGGGQKVAEELGCSQQSVSAWATGEWLPRGAMQTKLKTLYRIPMPWIPLVKTKVKAVRA